MTRTRTIPVWTTPERTSVTDVGTDTGGETGTIMGTADYEGSEDGIMNVIIFNDDPSQLEDPLGGNRHGTVVQLAALRLLGGRRAR